jgi:hypothetical protein
MQPNESPFPAYWYGMSLENVGLESVRPRIGTYGKYEFNQLPPVSFQIRGKLDWLAGARPHAPNIGDEKATENIKALADLRKSSEILQLHLPSVFSKFMETPSLHKRIRSNTDCFLDLCPTLIRSPLGGGYLIRFLADSQGCIFWYLYLNKDASDHTVVASPDFYGTESEQWQDEQHDPKEIVFTAESFEIFLYRFWLENEIWFSGYKNTPMPDAGIVYIENYLQKHA